MSNRLPVRDLFLALAILVFAPLFQCAMSEFVMDTQLGSTVAVGLAIICGFLLVAFADWVIWEDNERERAELDKLFRHWELFTGQPTARTSNKRSARWWWRPLRYWWLERKYGPRQ